MQDEKILEGICCEVENCVHNNGNCCCTCVKRTGFSRRPARLAGAGTPVFSCSRRMASNSSSGTSAPSAPSTSHGNLYGLAVESTTQGVSPAACCRATRNATAVCVSHRYPSASYRARISSRTCASLAQPQAKVSRMAESTSAGTV